MVDPRAALVQSVSLEIEPIRLALPYRVGMLFAAVAMLLLPLVYVGLIAAVAYAVWLHTTVNYGILLGSGGVQIRALLYVTPIVAGVVGVLFMIKPLFAPRPERAEPRTVRRDEQPLLHAYVERLCASLGAPAPRRIDVDMQVNASASFRRGIGSFLGEDLVLTLGLPLTAGMTLGQWTGVLAHEFGHFTQGAAMRFSYVIGSVNHWFARVVHERDAWDVWLDQQIRENRSGWAQIVLSIAKAFVWLTRRVLWVLMMVGLAVSSFLSRQMEFNADLHQARVSGSRLFRETHLRLPLLSVAWSQATSYLGVMWNERRLVDDVVGLVLAEERRLASSEEVVDRIRQSVEGGETGTFDTHPSTADRIRAIQARELPARMDDEAPASTVFEGFEELCREVTLTFYEGALGAPVDARSLVPTAVAISEQDAQRAKGEAFGSFFLGTRLGTTGVFPAAARAGGWAEGDLEAARGRLVELRARMEAGAPEVERSIDRLDEVGQRRRLAALYRRGVAAEAAPSPEAIGLSPEDADDADGVVESTTQEFEALLASLAEPGAVAAERLAVALSLVGHPELGEALSAGTEAEREVRRLVPVLASVAPHWDRLRTMQRSLFELGYLLSVAGPTIEPGPLQDEIVALWRSLRIASVRIRDASVEQLYPYPHAHGETRLADYFFEEIPEVGPGVGEVAAAGAQRVGDLYFRTWADLATVALQVERALGLPDLEPYRRPVSDPAE